MTLLNEFMHFKNGCILKLIMHATLCRSSLLYPNRVINEKMAMAVGLAVLYVGKEASRLVRELLEQTETPGYAPDTVEIRLAYWPGKMGFTGADVQKKAGAAFGDIKSSSVSRESGNTRYVYL